jgi:hypothetical protein
VPSLFPVTISSTKKEPSKQWYVITLADKLKKDVAYQLELSFTGTLTSDTTQGFFRASYQLHRTKEERLVQAEGKMFTILLFLWCLEVMCVLGSTGLKHSLLA